MRKIIYNYDNLSEEDITEVVIRSKALLIHDEIIFIANEKDVWRFPVGHLKERETLSQCLRR